MGMQLIIPLALALLASIAMAQPSCEPWAGAPAICAGLIDYDVWVPPNISQAFLAAALGSRTGVINLLPGECARAAIIVACSQGFRKCDSNGFPLPLCPEYCTFANDMCAGTFAFNCSDADPILAPAPLWSPMSGIPPFEPCAIANASTPSLICPYPFLFNNNTNQCAMKCPPTGLDNEHDQYAYYLTAAILAILSLIGCLLHIPPMILQYRANSSGYALWWFVCQVIGNIGILSGHWKPWKEFMCLDKFTIRNADSTFCAVSAVFNYNGYLGSTVWIVFIMYRILVGITRSKTAIFGPTGRIKFISEHTALHILAWGPHILLTIVLLSKGWISASSTYTCEVDASKKWVFYGMLIIPLTVYSFLSTVLSAAVLYFVVRNGMRAIVSQWRLFALAGYYTSVVTIVLAITYYSTERSDKVIAEAGRYVVCAATFGHMSCTFHNPIPFRLNYVSVVLVVSVGFIMSLLFWTRSTMAAWRYIIGRTTGLYSVSDWQSSMEPNSTTVSQTGTGSHHSNL